MGAQLLAVMWLVRQATGSAFLMATWRCLAAVELLRAAAVAAMLLGSEPVRLVRARPLT